MYFIMSKKWTIIWLTTFLGKYFNIWLQSKFGFGYKASLKDIQDQDIICGLKSAGSAIPLNEPILEHTSIAEQSNQLSLYTRR